MRQIKISPICRHGVMVGSRPRKVRPVAGSPKVVLLRRHSAVVHSPYPVPALTSVPVALLVISLPARDSELPDVPTEYVPLLILVPLVPLAAVAYGMRIWRLRAGERRTRMAELVGRRAEKLRRAASAPHTQTRDEDPDQPARVVGGVAVCTDAEVAETAHQLVRPDAGADLSGRGRGVEQL